MTLEEELPTPTWSPRKGRVGIAIAAVVVAAVGVVGFVTYSAGNPGKTPAQQMAYWVDNTQFGQSVATLIADNDRIDKVIAQNLGTNAIHTDCSVLVNDTEAANTELPAPNHALTNVLSDAYGQEGSAGFDCDAAGATNEQLLARSAAERAKGKSLLLHAYISAEALSQRTISTTTTTQPNSGGGLLG
jgi:hypothetical protein